MPGPVGWQATVRRWLYGNCLAHGSTSVGVAAVQTVGAVHRVAGGRGGGGGGGSADGRVGPHASLCPETSEVVGVLSLGAQDPPLFEQAPLVLPERLRLADQSQKLVAQRPVLGPHALTVHVQTRYRILHATHTTRRSYRCYSNTTVYYGIHERSECIPV